MPPEQRMYESLRFMWYQTQQFVYVVYDNFSMSCITYFDYSFFAYIVYDIKSDLKIFYILYNIFHSPQFKKMSLLTGVYGNVGHNILHEEEKIRRRNAALVYNPKKDELLPYCPLYVNHLVE